MRKTALRCLHGDRLDCGSGAFGSREFLPQRSIKHQGARWSPCGLSVEILNDQLMSGCRHSCSLVMMEVIQCWWFLMRLHDNTVTLDLPSIHLCCYSGSCDSAFRPALFVILYPSVSHAHLALFASPRSFPVSFPLLPVWLGDGAPRSFSLWLFCVSDLLPLRTGW